ncbi:MAG: hypothetical protein ABJI69_00920 [Balneola sp.]
MGEWTIVDVNKIKETQKYSIKVYSLAEMEDMFVAVGFKSLSIFGDWKGNEHDLDSKNVIVVAEK